MITPSFGLTATERVLPKLALDFTTASLDSRVTFTRSGATATRVNASGYIETMAANTPRFDFNPVTLVCRGLLIEEQRTNGFTYSEDWRDTATAGSTRPWSYQNASVLANTIAAPDNALTADTIVENTATSTHGVFQPFTVTSGAPTTLSFYAKAKERTQVASIMGGGGYGTSVTTIYDLVALTVTVTTGTGTATITDAGNGWRRCTCTATPTTNSATNHFIQLASGGANVYAGDGTSGAYFWGAQVEVGAFATSYIPTVASQVTRTADVATMTGTNFSDWYNAAQGSFAFTGDTLAIGTIRIGVAVSRTSGGFGYIQLKTPRPPGTTGFTVQDDAGAITAELTGSAITINTAFTVCGGYKVNDFGFADRGAATVVDTSGAVPTGLDRMGLGWDFGTSYQNGHIASVRFWPQKLITAEIQAFSK